MVGSSGVRLRLRVLVRGLLLALLPGLLLHDLVRGLLLVLFPQGFSDSSLSMFSLSLIVLGLWFSPYDIVTGKQIGRAHV